MTGLLLITERLTSIQECSMTAFRQSSPAPAFAHQTPSSHPLSDPFSDLCVGNATAQNQPLRRRNAQAQHQIPIATQYHIPAVSYFEDC
jgi:hypothetical protein